jgi:hypothetical protein
MPERKKLTMAIAGLACFEAKKNHRLLHPPPSMFSLEQV